MQTTRRTPARFRERSELLDYLLEVSAVTSATLDLDELLGKVAEIIRNALPYDLLAILLYSEKRRDLRIRYAVGHREEVVRSGAKPCFLPTCVATPATSTPSTPSARRWPRP